MNTETATPTRQVIRDVDTQAGLDRIQHLLGLYLDRHELSMRDLSLRAGENAGLVKDLMSGRLRGLPRAKTLQGLSRAMRIDDPMALVDPSRPEPDLSKTPAPRGARARRASEWDSHSAQTAGPNMSQMIELNGSEDNGIFGYLRRDVVLRSMVASTNRLRVALALVPTDDGRVERGDYVVIDTSELGRSIGGLSVRLGPDGIEGYIDAKRGTETDGRVAGVIRPM